MMMPAAEMSTAHRHALRVYGISCIVGQAMVLSKGATIDDAFLIASGAVGLAGRISNAIWNDKAKPYTPPALILSACLALLSGLCSLVAHGPSSTTIEHMAFGSIKATGLAVMFYGNRFALFHLTKSMPPERIGKYLLNTATTALAIDGIQQLIEGLAGGDTIRIVNGALTLLASTGFYIGQHYASISQRYDRIERALIAPA